MSALEALGVALEILFSFQFAGVCDVLIEALRGHLRPLKLTDSGFLVHSIDRVLVKFFRTVSKDDTALEFPECDITKPAGCATLLKTMLAAMILDLTDVVKVTILERRYTLLMRLRKERLVAAPTPPGKAKLKLNSPQAQGREKGCGPMRVTPRSTAKSSQEERQPADMCERSRLSIQTRKAQRTYESISDTVSSDHARMATGVLDATCGKLQSLQSLG